jgi:quinohemoprotein ethanol dehydrogenase
VKSGQRKRGGAKVMLTRRFRLRRFGRSARIGFCAVCPAAITLLMLFAHAVPASSAVPEAPNWASYGLDSSENRFSALDQINLDTVKSMGLVWSLDLPNENSLEATPLAIDGVIYFPGGMGVVYAVAASSGKLLWKYDPESGTKMPPERWGAFPVNRGLAYSSHSVFVATRDGRMIAIDTGTGRPRWTSEFLISGDSTSSNGAPRACGSNVIIGNTGGESGGRGYVTALNIETGKIAWRFFTVPGNPAVDKDWTTRTVANTWSGDWWKAGGGGAAWNALTCDLELGQVLIGTENAEPYSWQERSDNGKKDNLFTDSIVAVDTDTGAFRWHYQFVPAEAFDFKAIEDIVTAHLNIGGIEHKVLLQANGNGFFYVIDRVTGKVLTAEEYGKQNWTDGIDLKTGKPRLRLGVRYGQKSVNVYPGLLAAHNWQAMSYDPAVGLAYIPYIQIGTKFAELPAARKEIQDPELVEPGKHAVWASQLIDPKDPLDGKGSLIAWNVEKKAIEWRVNYPCVWNGGTLVTRGGLVFQGLETGQFMAYNARSGKEVWSFNANLGIMAPPITFFDGGRQYVSVLVGYGGSGGLGKAPFQKCLWNYGEQPRRLLTFAIGGTATLPPTPPRQGLLMPLDDPKLAIDPGEAAGGRDLYNFWCTGCHNIGATGSAVAPNLQASRIALDEHAFIQYVAGGYAVSAGMPKWPLSLKELKDIYQYIRHTARSDLSGRAGSAASQEH